MRHSAVAAATTATVPKTGSVETKPTEKKSLIDTLKDKVAAL